MPSGNVTVTVEFGSAVPLTSVAFVSTSFIVGASGAVASTTVVVALSDSLPSASLEVALIVSPPLSDIFSGMCTV